MNPIDDFLWCLEFDESSELLKLDNDLCCQLCCFEHPFDGVIFYSLLINGKPSNTTESRSRMKRLLKEWKAGKRKIENDILC